MGSTAPGALHPPDRSCHWPWCAASSSRPASRLRGGRIGSASWIARRRTPRARAGLPAAAEAMSDSDAPMGAFGNMFARDTDSDEAPTHRAGAGVTAAAAEVSPSHRHQHPPLPLNRALATNRLLIGDGEPGPGCSVAASAKILAPSSPAISARSPAQGIYVPPDARAASKFVGLDNQ